MEDTVSAAPNAVSSETCSQCSEHLENLISVIMDSAITDTGIADVSTYIEKTLTVLIKEFRSRRMDTATDMDRWPGPAFSTTEGEEYTETTPTVSRYATPEVVAKLVSVPVTNPLLKTTCEECDVITLSSVQAINLLVTKLAKFDTWDAHNLMSLNVKTRRLFTTAVDANKMQLGVEVVSKFEHLYQHDRQERHLGAESAKATMYGYTHCTPESISSIMSTTSSIIHDDTILLQQTRDLRSKPISPPPFTTISHPAAGATVQDAKIRDTSTSDSSDADATVPHAGATPAQQSAPWSPTTAPQGGVLGQVPAQTLARLADDIASIKAWCANVVACIELLSVCGILLEKTAGPEGGCPSGTIIYKNIRAVLEHSPDAVLSSAEERALEAQGAGKYGLAYTESDLQDEDGHGLFASEAMSRAKKRVAKEKRRLAKLMRDDPFTCMESRAVNPARTNSKKHAAVSTGSGMADFSSTIIRRRLLQEKFSKINTSSFFMGLSDSKSKKKSAFMVQPPYASYSSTSITRSGLKVDEAIPETWITAVMDSWYTEVSSFKSQVQQQSSTASLAVPTDTAPPKRRSRQKQILQSQRTANSHPLAIPWIYIPTVIISTLALLSEYLRRITGLAGQLGGNTSATYRARVGFMANTLYEIQGHTSVTQQVYIDSFFSPNNVVKKEGYFQKKADRVQTATHKQGKHARNGPDPNNSLPGASLEDELLDVTNAMPSPSVADVFEIRAEEPPVFIPDESYANWMT